LIRGAFLFLLAAVSTDIRERQAVSHTIVLFMKAHSESHWAPHLLVESGPETLLLQTPGFFISRFFLIPSQVGAATFLSVLKCFIFRRIDAPLTFLFYNSFLIFLSVLSRLPELVTAAAS